MKQGPRTPTSCLFPLQVCNHAAGRPSWTEGTSGTWNSVQGLRAMQARQLPYKYNRSTAFNSCSIHQFGTCWSIPQQALHPPMMSATAFNCNTTSCENFFAGDMMLVCLSCMGLKNAYICMATFRVWSAAGVSVPGFHVCQSHIRFF